MSIWGTVGHFFANVGKELETLFGKAAQVEQKIQSVVVYVSPFVVSLIALVDPAISTEATDIIDIIKSDLATISTVAKGAVVAPGTPEAQAITAAISSINTNMAGLLNLADVKNSANVTKIEAVAGLITGELNAVVGSLTAPAAPAA